MKARLGRIAVATLAMAALSLQLAVLTPARADYSPSDAEPFLIQPGYVAATDGAPSNAHTTFTIACATATSSPVWATDGSAPTCQNGDLTIYVTPNTQFYFQVDGTTGGPCTTSTGCVYKPSTYDNVINPGGELRIGGYWARVNYSTYKFTANYIWNPGTGINDPPPIPRPSTPQDYDFSHRFVVNASVKEMGAGLTGGALWSTKWGMVVGNIPTTVDPTTQVNGYYNNDQVQAIAMAHRDPTTLDPQLGISTNDVQPASTLMYGLPLTRYWVQNPVDMKYYPSTKDGTVNAIGAPLLVAGAYAFVNGDWTFLALYVWRPAPGPQPGYASFAATATRPAGSASTTTDVSESYSGTTSGDGNVNPASISFSTTWSLSSSSWQVNGSWKVVRCQYTDGTPVPGCNDPGTLTGTFSGTWDPASGNVQTDVVLDTGTGKWCGDYGTGTFSGVSPGTPDSPPPALQGAFNLRMNHDASAVC